MKISEVEENSNNNLYNNDANKTFLPKIGTVKNIPVINGFTNNIYENFFTDKNDDNLTNNKGILNEDIFKKRKFSGVNREKNKFNQHQGYNNNNGLENILKDKKGKDNKIGGFVSEPKLATINNGKIYRNLSK